MEFTLKSNPGRRLIALFEVAILGSFIVWVTKSYFARTSGSRLNLLDLQTAIRLDSSDSDYHLKLGRLAQYNVADINPDLALESLRRAAELNPRNTEGWLELAAAYGFMGKNDEAETCLRRADFLAPYLPSVQLVVGNFYLSRGENDEAFRHFRTVLSGSNQYNHNLSKIAWKASDDGQRILQELIPDNVATEMDYLYFPSSQRRFVEAKEVWKRVAVHKERLDSALVAGYLDQLINAHLPADALQV